MPIDTHQGTAPREGASVASLVGRHAARPAASTSSRTRASRSTRSSSRSNPGGSVKDRAALAMILDGERRGALGPGRVLLDATSGNTGIAYAMLGAARGYPRAAVRAGQRHARAQAAPARLRRRARADRSDGRQRRRDPRGAAARRATIPTRTSTRTSTTTRRTGARTTTRPAPEIIEQTDGRLTHFVAGLGTSGTFVGTGRRLREWQPVGAADLGAAGLAAPRARRPEAHGLGDRAGHLRPVARRRGSARRDRGRATR